MRRFVITAFARQNDTWCFILEDTLGLKPTVWRVLAHAHNARNRSEYEGASDVNERMLKDLLTAATAVAKTIGDLPPLK